MCATWAGLAAATAVSTADRMADMVSRWPGRGSPARSPTGWPRRAVPCPASATRRHRRCRRPAPRRRSTVRSTRAARPGYPGCGAGRRPAPTAARRSASGVVSSTTAPTQPHSQPRKSSGVRSGSTYASRLSKVDEHRRQHVVQPGGEAQDERVLLLVHRGQELGDPVRAGEPRNRPPAHRCPCFAPRGAPGAAFPRRARCARTRSSVQAPPRPTPLIGPPPGSGAGRRRRGRRRAVRAGRSAGPRSPVSGLAPKMRTSSTTSTPRRFCRVANTSPACTARPNGQPVPSGPPVSGLRNL